MGKEKNAKEDFILHVFVVGFHHKKGCQVEYCYPPLNPNAGDMTGVEPELPKEWQQLPSLALPDGAHNVDKDTVFFLLPSRETPNQAIYGVSCYRQMAAKELVSRSADVTRSSVQKSVCVLSRLPLFGLLKAKLELITQAYFNERNFSRVEVLGEMFHSLVNSVSADLVRSQALLELSPRTLVRQFGHRLLVVFKLLLLEKRVLFHMFPVHSLCHTLLATLSLYPRMIEFGLLEAANYVPRSQLLSSDSLPTGAAQNANNVEEEEEEEESLLEEIEATLRDSEVSRAESAASAVETKKKAGVVSGIEIGTEVEEKSSEWKSYSSLQTDGWGLPLSIFSKGCLCLPYISLGLLDVLRQDSVRSYVFGATNALFRQRKDMLDVIISEDESGEVQLEFLQDELRRQLTLTTADLRFSDYLVKAVSPETGDVFVDATGWEGGDEWIRLQFRSYLLSLIATSRCENLMQREDFGESFLRAWKATHNYRLLSCGHYPDLDNAMPGHPFAGQLTVADVGVRLHSIMSTAQGRRLTKAVSQTSKSVRSVVSSWWSDVAGRNDSHPSDSS